MVNQHSTLCQIIHNTNERERILLNLYFSSLTAKHRSLTLFNITGGSCQTCPFMKIRHFLNAMWAYSTRVKNMCE
jgi:hypothetical protein